jgi:hypothetical protein
MAVSDDYDLVGPDADAHCFHDWVSSKLFDMPGSRIAFGDEAIAGGDNPKIRYSTAE